ncbi:MAG: methyltransferase domain-containing protein [Armatimonadetes bacterium]|nr:methyltransferase domain-containing protein [Armatimonadota bacterium]
MDRNAFVAACTGLGISLSHSQIERFVAFEDALYQANEVMNLTRVPREECVTRHFLDSLLLGTVITQLNPEARVLDIGCGPGFPSWCLACAYPSMDVTALDSNGKMLGFLRSQPLPNLTVIQQRVEEWDVEEEYEIVTGRAVAPLTIQLEISAKPTEFGGHVILMRTPQDDFASSAAGKLGLKLVDSQEILLPGTDILRVFPIYRKDKETPKTYPRPWAMIKKRPL